MCHAAVWLVDGVTTPPHGQHFKAWLFFALVVATSVVREYGFMFAT